MTKHDKPRWGLHMQIPEIRETLFEISKQLNPPKKKAWKGKKPRPHTSKPSV